jgi:hypothetical protein
VEGSASSDLWLCAHAGGARRGVSMSKCDGVRYSTMEDYHDAALLSGLDVQAGAAVVLRSACRHLGAEAEVEIG